MTESAANAAAEAADDAADTIIELVEHIPASYMIAAALLGAAIAIGVMLALSKPSAQNDTPPTV